mmetsp:Transcript_19156/g.41923  ORF Transcript_19156/g.41923 Transcript_19156/m.41923 type:complete len:260 (-) Transcript_19156:265-1044(-)
MLPAMLGRATVHSCADARALARHRLPWMVFDYIDGAAGEGYGERLNREALQAVRLQPRVLNNVEERSLNVDLLGREAGLPFGISPMGMCNLATPGADLMLARLAAKHRIPVGVSTVASTSLEKMIEVAEGHAWFQLYFSNDAAAADALLGRCAAAARSAEALEVADAAMAAAAAAHVPVFDRTYQTLMLAWERIGERTKCIDKMLEMKERGWSPDAQILLDLYQWCMEEGDQDSAAVVEKELVLSGKAQYLAALASPRC